MRGGIAMYVFPIRCEGEPVLKHIFPSKQKAAQKAIELARSDSRIKRLIIFGSAVTMKCGAGSDLDIAIDAPEIKNLDEFGKMVRPFYIEIPSEIDVLHLNKINSDLLLNNIQKGVCVYDKQ